MESLLRFDSDYMEGCCPEILSRLEKINLIKQTGYGLDPISDSARAKIRKACGLGKEAEIRFLIGGTQANSTVIAALLNPAEGVFSAETGHINCHESGAVENTGHKVIPLHGEDGRLKADEIKAYCEKFYADGTWTHQVIPGMVYLSHPAENGTIYSLDELKEIRKVCDQYDLRLFIDGARLGYGLMAENTDVTLQDIGALADAFYIGGTKVGALFGEAVVLTGRTKVRNFFTLTKQHGALLAKGWLTGLQFDTLFTDDLYLRLAENAVKNALYFKQEAVKKGYELYADSPTNQQFLILSEEKMRELEGKVTFSIWEPLDKNKTAVRFAFSWAATKEETDQLLALL